MASYDYYSFVFYVNYLGEIMFINYNSNTDTLSINSYRLASAISCGDIGEFAEEYQDGHCATLYIDPDYTHPKETLCDGEYWQGSDITQDTLEAIYNLFVEYEG